MRIYLFMVLCALSLKQARLLCGHEVGCIRLSVCLSVSLLLLWALFLKKTVVTCVTYEYIYSIINSYYNYR